jgi:hypothetical protein
VSNLSVLVSVSWAEGREDLQKSCVQENWALARLEEEVKLRFGQRQHGGRRRQVSAGIGGALVQLADLCGSWERWVSAAGETGVLGKLPEKVRQQAKAIGKAVRRLAKAVDAELGAARERLRQEEAKKKKKKKKK